MSSLQKRPFSWGAVERSTVSWFIKDEAGHDWIPFFFFLGSSFLFFFCPLYILPLLGPIVRYFRALRTLHQRNAVDVLSRIHSDTSVSRIFLTWASRNTIRFYSKILWFFRIYIFVLLSGNGTRYVFSHVCLFFAVRFWRLVTMRLFRWENVTVWCIVSTKIDICTRIAHLLNKNWMFLLCGWEKFCMRCFNCRRFGYHFCSSILNACVPLKSMVVFL